MMEWLHPDHLIATFGLVGIIVIVFAESGILAGFFLPGDSLLVTAGLLASAGRLDLTALLLGVTAAAILGDQVGYLIGSRAGVRLLTRERWYSRPHHVARARNFFETHGGRAVVLARFVPVIRTFVPFTAGTLSMPYRPFVAYNVAGGLLWGVGVTMLGFTLGQVVPDVDRYLLPIIGLIVVVSLLPVLHGLRAARQPQLD